MGDLREDIALAGNPRNLWSEVAVRDAAVKLGALGKADPLGAALWRLKYRGDVRQAKRCLVLMAHRLRDDRRWRLSVQGRAPNRGGRGAPRAPVELQGDVIDRLVFRVLWEWVNDRCPCCHGRGTVGRLGAVTLCSMCGGSGRIPPQHSTRIVDLGVSHAQYEALWRPLIDGLLTRLAEIDADVGKVLRQQVAVNRVTPSAADHQAA